jgi:hypothetical protein
MELLGYTPPSTAINKSRRIGAAELQHIKPRAGTDVAVSTGIKKLHNEG